MEDTVALGALIHRQRGPLALIAALLALALAAAPAAAKVQTWTYPSSRCPRGPAGLQNCADSVAHAGDTIAVKPGVYYQNPNISRRVRITGNCHRPAAVVIDATSKTGTVGDGVTVSSSGVTLECLKIRHATGLDAIDVNGVHTNVKVEHVRVVDGADGVAAPAGANGLVVEDSSFSSLGDAAVSVASGTTTSDTIKGNTVSGSSGLCLSLNLSRSTVSNNKLTTCTTAGLLITGNANTVAGNALNASGGPGAPSGGSFEVDGTGNHVTGNSVEGVAANAFAMDPGTGDVITGNSVGGDTEGVDFVVSGNGLKITNNLMRPSSYEGGIYLTGNDVTVDKNIDEGPNDDDFIEVIGDDATISGNQARGGANAAAVDVEGAAPVVTNNVATGGFDYSGFVVNCTSSCAKALVSGNVESGAETDPHASGFEIYTSGCTAQGCITVTHNAASHNLDDGFYLATQYATITDNTATLNGHGSPGCNHLASGFELVSGDANNYLQGNTATQNACDGFYADSASNDLQGNTARQNGVMGFQVEDANNVVNLNTALDNKGDGINNDGTATMLTNNNSSGDRQDCTNDSGEGATIASSVSSDKCADGHDFNWASSLTGW